MSIRVKVLLAMFFIVIVWTLYNILNESQKLKTDKILKNIKAMEDKLDSVVSVDNTKYLKKYKGIMQESILSKFFINIYLFTFVAGLIGLIAFVKVRVLLNQNIAALLIAIMMFFVPFILLDIEITINRNKLRKNLPNFLLLFYQTYTCYSSSAEEALQVVLQETKRPIRGYIKELSSNINNKNMDIRRAIDICKSRTENEVFRSFCDTLYLNMRNGTRMDSDMENLHDIATSHKVNDSTRRAEHLGAMSGIPIMLIFLGIMVHSVFSYNGDLIDILLYNPIGKMLVNATIIIFILMAFMLRKSIQYKDN